MSQSPIWQSGRVSWIASSMKQSLKTDVEEATSRDRPTQMREVKAEASPAPGDFVKDFVRLPESSRPVGSVALDFECDMHGGRLMRIWMSHQAEDVTFGREGREGAWATDASSRGAVVVTCTRHRCRRSASLTDDWLVARFSKVRADFDAGEGPPIAWFPLSQVGVSSR